METPYTLIVVCSVVLIQLWLPVAYSRPEMSEMQELMDNDYPMPANYEDSLAPGYGRQQCNAHKPCPRGKYCHMFMCMNCKGEKQPCNNKGQCCRGKCSYGRCKGSAIAGGPGTFCRSLNDCRDKRDSCCVREPAVNPHQSICKPRLRQNQICGPRGWAGKTMWPGDCGPCRRGLACKQIGIHGIHEVCLP